MPKNDSPQARRFLASMEKHGALAAGEEFCREHPLSKVANPRKRYEWAEDLCAFLNDRYDAETVRAIRMDCACGPARTMVTKLRALYEEDRDPAGFAQRLNDLDLGFTVEYDGASFCVVYPQCYCSCVARDPGLLPGAWCECTCGFNRRLFEGILGQEVRAELLRSVKLGDPVCRIRITVQEAQQPPAEEAAE